MRGIPRNIHLHQTTNIHVNRLLWQAIRPRDVVLSTITPTISIQRRICRSWRIIVTHHRQEIFPVCIQNNRREGDEATDTDRYTNEAWYPSSIDIPSIWDIAAAHFSITSNGNDAFFVLTHLNPNHTTRQTPTLHTPNPTTTKHH